MTTQTNPSANGSQAADSTPVNAFDSAPDADTAAMLALLDEAGMTPALLKAVGIAPDLFLSVPAVAQTAIRRAARLATRKVTEPLPTNGKSQSPRMYSRVSLPNGRHFNAFFTPAAMRAIIAEADLIAEWLDDHAAQAADMDAAYAEWQETARRNGRGDIDDLAIPGASTVLS